jgi:hypothetical protein
MASAASRRLKILAKEIPDDRATQALLHGLNMHESDFVDRSVAIIGSSLVEKALEIAILGKFIPLGDEARKRLFEYEHRGPLCDFSARIKVAGALDLIGPKTQADLDLLREVRNAFAHSPTLLKFSTPEVGEM